MNAGCYLLCDVGLALAVLITFSILHLSTYTSTDREWELGHIGGECPGGVTARPCLRTRFMVSLYLGLF